VTLPVKSATAVTYYVASHGAVHLTIAQPDGTDLSRDALCTSRVIQTVAPSPSCEQLIADAGGGEAVYARYGLNAAPVLGPVAPIASALASHAGTLQIGPSAVTVFGARYEAFPSVVMLTDGRLLLVWRSGATHTSVDGVIKASWSSDLGRTWTTPVTILSDALDLRDPNISLLADGSVALLFFKYTGTIATLVYYSRSIDGGANWTTPVATTSPWNLWAASSGPVVQMTDGSLVAAVYGMNTGDTYTSAAAIRSTDLGASWSAAGTIALGATISPAAQEPNLGTLADGSLLCMTRSGTATVYQSTSTDGGVTWTSPSATFGSANSSLRWTRTSTGALIVVYRGNDAQRAYYRVSLNGGTSWQGSLSEFPASPLTRTMEYASLKEVAPGLVAFALAEEAPGGATSAVTFRWIVNGVGIRPLGDETGSFSARSSLAAAATEVYDDFQRPDATDLATTVTSSGHAWTTITGGWQILNGLAYWNSGTPAVNTVKCSRADGEVTADLAVGSSVANGIAFRVVNSTNYLRVEITNSGADIALIKKDTGADTTLATGAGVNIRQNQWTPVRVTFRDDRIKIFVDGEKVVDYTASAGETSKYGSSKLHGLYCSAQYSRCRRWVYTYGGSI